MLKVEHITYAIGAKKILENVDATFLPGELTMILGPNGSGKSSFLKIFSGEITHYKGQVFYDDTSLHQLKKEELAKRRAVLSQLPELSFPLTVEEVVMMGRYPHFQFNPSQKDKRICKEAIEQMNLHSFQHRNYLTLSGGEKQRVQFARVLAQIWEPPVTGCRYLFLDEPLTSLDIKYQKEFLEMAQAFSLKDTVVVAIVHDMNLAMAYGKQWLFMKEGRLVHATKNTADVSASVIEEVFEVPAHIMQSGDGKNVIIF